MGIVRRKKLRAGGGTDDGYIGTVDVKRYNFYSLFFFTDFRDFFFSASAFIALMILSGRLRGRGKLSFRKKSLPSGSGHGEKVFWGGCGAAAGKCGTKIPGVSYERDKGGKDL